MNSYKHLKNILNFSIKKMAQSCSIFCKNPEKVFSRVRKLDFETTLKNIIYMETGSLKDELLKLNDFSFETPAASAFIQARSKIKVETFKILFDSFNDKTHEDKLYKGYCLLAIDDSELPIDNTIYDEETTLLKHDHTNQSYCAYRLNTCYDLLEISSYKVKLK